ncbi:MAG: insulinase family protein [Gemmatimonadota bacterium]|nr:insulinase family protein [Gemmatimonadota bacterium]
MTRFPIERYELENGLRVVLSPDATHPLVAVNLWYNVGSRNEREGRTGFAHLFEHMMFQGSQNVPDTQHIAHIERAGGSMNGSTWLDRTNYFETLPSNRLELALWLESDRMGFLLPAMTREKLDNQRDVVKNERRWRVDNQPYGDWDERIQMMMYPSDHPYHHSVIGSMEDLDAADLEDVSQFFSTFYTPNNAVLTLCGDFERDEAMQLVAKYFGDIPRGPDPPPLPGKPEVPTRLEAPAREVVESKVALPRVYIAFRVPPYGTDLFQDAEVATRILGTGGSSRLYDAMVREGRLAQNVGGYAFPIVTGAAMLVFWITGSPGVPIEQAEEAFWKVLGELAENGCEPEELEREITSQEAQRMISLQRVSERANEISMFTTLFDEPERVNTELDRLRSVTREGVTRFTWEYLTREHAGVLVYLPEGGTGEVEP